ncbi:heterokaryon incompatibility protein-domain-containing protein [Lasiosphaeris hirsuta]|uniref:Heterokaryon incompatibility protein-domain-containing protein n=1 Tax=Lasiosphaeris hirsuta TaxID=260670 RepID=A0AA40A0X7_9PEZI|nr:heterokaryon incompatibility protein-domain-containing protein [Lasiosphaeris hirsuta]
MLPAPAPKEYAYAELPGGSIRLLHLLPDEKDGHSIQCQLFNYPIQNTGERASLYEALSYCWGNSDKPNRISIGDRYLPITASLYAALLRLRDRFIGRVMWVDAICINQADVEERGHQVRSMAEIYSKANRVVVWLGEAEAHDHDTFKAILAAGDKSSNLPGEKHEAIHALLNRPWFRRIWVLQEVAAARNVRIMCGSAEVDGYGFCLGLEALPGMQDRTSSVTYLMKRSVFRPQYKIDLAGRVSLDICPLGGLIDMYHTREATDPRDKVFALLGMSSDDSSIIEAAGLSPDYGILWEELWKRLVKFILGGQTSVSAWPDRETAVIEGKGCVLGVVSSADEESVCVTPKTLLLPKEWASQPSVKPVRAGDLVCLLQGAPRPMIIRPREDHFSAIILSVTALGSIKTENGGRGRLQHTLPSSLYEFLLIWTWGAELLWSRP